MSLHIDRLTSHVELLADTPEHPKGGVPEPYRELAAHRAALAEVLALERRIRAEGFDD